MKPNIGSGAQPRGEVTINRAGQEGATEHMEEVVQDLISPSAHEPPPYISSYVCGTWRRRDVAFFSLRSSAIMTDMLSVDRTFTK